MFRLSRLSNRPYVYREDYSWRIIKKNLGDSGSFILQFVLIYFYFNTVLVAKSNTETLP